MRILRTRFALRTVRSILHGYPVAASYFVTNRCNYDCEFCDYPSFNNDKKEELSVADLDGIGAKLARAGVVMVAIIGGEPFIRKDLPDVVRALSKHLMVQITTNGWFIDDAVAREIYAAGVYMVNVSLDSSRPELHNQGRQNPQAFERAIRAVKALRDAPKIASDQMVGFESILSGRNYNHCEDMVRLAEELGVHIVFQPFSSGHADDQPKDMPQVDGDPSRRFHELKTAHPCLYNNRAMIDRLTPFFKHGGIPDCQAGRTYFNIDSYGWITRCEEQQRRYGDLRKLNVHGIHAVLEQMQRDTRSDGCSSCYLRTRGETEPLYEGGFDHFLEFGREMFNLPLPPFAARIARVPGLTGLLRTGLDAAARLDVL